MKVCVDQEQCIGCGLCVSTAPDVFEMNGDEKAEATGEIDSENEDSVIEALESCPVSAISEEEE